MTRMTFEIPRGRESLAGYEDIRIGEGANGARFKSSPGSRDARSAPLAHTPGGIG